MEMKAVVILVCYNGKWVTSKKMCKYEGGDSKGLIVPRTISFAELLDRVHPIGNTNSREDKVCLKFSVLVASNEWKHIKIEDDESIHSGRVYNEVYVKYTPIVIGIIHNGEVWDLHEKRQEKVDKNGTYNKKVAIVESNEVTRNNTNVADVGGDVGTDFIDMIDFSEVEEMHGGDNDTETNEVSVYSAPPILSPLDTST
ncbi:unnamed protein product [Prunus armeniaca]